MNNGNSGRSRLVNRLWVAVVAVGCLAASLVVTAGPAQAGTCYGGAMSWDAGELGNGYTYSIPGGDDAGDRSWDGRQVYRASSRCRDVNLRMSDYYGSSYVKARVCEYNVANSTALYCRSWHTFWRGDYSWRVLASGLPDGRLFYVEFDYNQHIWGYIAY